MDADTILRIKPALTRFLHHFDDCFDRVSTRRYLDLYVQGWLSDLERKSIEPTADARGEPLFAAIRRSHRRARGVNATAKRPGAPPPSPAEN